MLVSGLWGSCDQGSGLLRPEKSHIYQEGRCCSHGASSHCMSIPFCLFSFCLYNRCGQASTSTDEECPVIDAEHLCVRYR